MAKPLSPRPAFIASLAEHLEALALAGDIEAARVASDALACLLGSDPAPAPVVDFVNERLRRGR